MSYLLHAEGQQFSIIERVYDLDAASNKTIRLEAVIEEGLSFARAKALLKHLIKQASVVKELEYVSPIETDTPIEGSSSSKSEVLQSNAGLYIGRTFDGIPYERLSG